MDSSVLARCLLCLLSFMSTCNTEFSNKYDLWTNHFNIIGNEVCKEIWCDQYSNYYIKEMFPGVLLSKEQNKRQQDLYQQIRKKYLYKEGIKDVDHVVRLPGDGDSCCSTTIETHINTSMTNIDGELQPIVHMPDSEPPMYQFIPHATCQCPETTSCAGICVLEYVVHTYLTYDARSTTFIFDQFLLPGYCSCKNVLR